MRWRCVLGHAVLVTFLAGMAVVTGLITRAINVSDAGMAYVWVAVALQVAATPVLVVRRRAPVVAALVVVGTAVAQLVVVSGAPGDLASTYVAANAWMPLVLSIVVDNLVDRGVRRSGATPVWVLIGLLTVLATRPWDPDWGVIVNGLLHTAVPPLFGLYLAVRRRLIRVLRERAERAEREQHLLAARARAEERARLAAEMHDVVAHRVTLIVLQAGALELTAPDAATRTNAGELRTNGCLALEELRELVGVLRSDRSDDTVTDDTAPTRDAPVPELATLAEDSDRVGLAVELVEDGTATGLSPVVGRTVHRVVQEALTNVRKHAWGSRVRVHAVYGEDEIRVTVRNSAPAAGPDGPLAATGSGTGLAGLRERVELVGGSLSAGPALDGGFQVEATLPARVGS